MKKYMCEIKTNYVTTIHKLQVASAEEAWAIMTKEQAENKYRRLTTKVFVFDSSLHMSGVCNNKTGMCVMCLEECHTIVLNTDRYRRTRGNKPSGKMRKDLAVR